MQDEFKDLKKKLIIRGGLYFAIIVIMVGIFIFTLSVKNSSVERQDWLKNDISSLKSKLDSLNKKSKEFAESVTKWENFSDEKKKLDGLKINIAKDTLDKLAERYKFTAMEMTFSKPKTLTEGYDSDSVTVMQSDVNISFGAITDVSVYNFINALAKELPGYTQINDISITRDTGIISKDLLMKISEGEYPQILNVRMDFSWWDMKLIENSNDTTNEK